MYGLIISLSTQFRVQLLISPVPITAQTLTVLLAGVLLGPKRGSLAVITYLVFGTLGWLPFAGGALLGPTGGYLLGFVLSAYLVGVCTAKLPRKMWWSTPMVLLLGNAVIYLVGLPWLAFFIGWPLVLKAGLFPFVVGDLLKLVCAFGIWRVLDLEQRKE